MKDTKQTCVPGDLPGYLLITAGGSSGKFPTKKIPRPCRILQTCPHISTMAACHETDPIQAGHE